MKLYLMFMLAKMLTRLVLKSKMMLIIKNYHAKNSLFPQILSQEDKEEFMLVYSEIY